MSGRSYNHYMRPQDRDGNNHANGRGRSQHLAPSRGRSRERSYDVHYDERNYCTERDMRGDEGRRDQYHRSRSSDYAPHSRSHRSRSFDPHPNRYNSSHHDNSSRKRHRPPDHRRIHDPQANEHNRDWSARSFGHGRRKDTRYERRPLAPTNGNGADMHRAPANEFHRYKNTENYANASYGSDMSNMNNYHSHYYQPSARYDHPKSTSNERRPLSSLQDFKPNPTQRSSTHLFNNTHTISELIQIAHTNLAILKPSLTAAFWNKVSKQMSGRNASSSRLPNHHYELGRYLNQIFEHSTRTLRLFSMRDLSETIYSMAKLVDELRKHGGRRRGDDIIDVLSSLLMNNDMTPKRSLFLSLANASRDKLDNFDARNLSNVAYAYALINYVPEFDDESDLFDHIATQAALRLRSAEFNAQDTSNMMWAYATVGKPHALLFEAMGDQVVAREHLGEFKPQNLANTAWAFAKAGISHPNLFEKVANHAARIDVLYGFKPQELAITVWAFAAAGISHPKLFEKVANNIVGQDNLDTYNSQDLANIVWAFGKAGAFHPELFQTIANHIVSLSNLDRFNSQDLSSTMWAYATAQVPHPKLFKKVADTAIRSKGEFDSQSVANLLWAYATMGIIDKQLFVSFVPTAAKLIDSFNNQELANMAWAYAVANVDAPTLFNAHFINKCVEKECEIGIKEISQLYQWHLWQTMEKSNPGLPVELQERCYNVFISEEPTVSKFQDDVVAHLLHIGLDPKEEVLMGSGYRIDALVEVSGKQVGIEVDGPSHFIGRSKFPLARTILKRRQVPSIDNIELVFVPYWEWEKLGNDEVKKQDYLRVLLEL
eukprot:scaffold5585_cov94-Skeletonema_dohrnii-CCMP3373.AAC.3